MTATKHTLGPWTVEDPMGPETLWIVEADKRPNEWRCIAMVCNDEDEEEDGTPPISKSEQNANARLIAAAPDLLAALKRMRVITQQHISPACDAADAAITKAEGKP